MRPLVMLALSLPFGPAQQAPPETWTRTDVMGLVLLTGPADTRVGLSGVTSTMPAKVAGGEGTLSLRQGLTRDVSLTVRDADVKVIAGLFDLPKWLDGKLRGRVGLVTLTIQGDAFTLKASGFRIPGEPLTKVEATGDLKTQKVSVRAFMLGGLVEYSGRLPGRD